MGTRLKDVAERAEVSVGLVSRILNNQPGIWASAETCRRVLDAAATLGYQPSAAARNLRRGRTNTVALVVPAGDPLQHGSFAPVAAQLAAFLYARDHLLLIQPLPDPQQALDHLNGLARTRTCDLVVLWGAEHDIEAQAALLQELQMPFVVKGRFECEHPDWLQVDFDHEAMMSALVSRFAAAGHRRLAYLGYAADEPFRHRLVDGVNAAVAATQGIALAPGGILEASNFPEACERAVSGWRALPEEERPTALIVGAEGAWEGLELALARVGMRLGEGPDRTVAAGNALSDQRLLLGQASFYDTAFTGLATVLCEQLIGPLLDGRPVATPIIRYLPPLRPAPSLALVESGALRLPQRQP